MRPCSMLDATDDGRERGALAVLYRKGRESASVAAACLPASSGDSFTNRAKVEGFAAYKAAFSCTSCICYKTHITVG